MIYGSFALTSSRGDKRLGCMVSRELLEVTLSDCLAHWLPVAVVSIEFVGLSLPCSSQ